MEKRGGASVREVLYTRKRGVVAHTYYIGSGHRQILGGGWLVSPASPGSLQACQESLFQNKMGCTQRMMLEVG